MNRNTIIGIVIIVLILVIFSYINRKPAEQVKKERIQDSIAYVRVSDSLKLAAKNDSITKADSANKNLAKTDSLKKGTARSTGSDSLAVRNVKDSLDIFAGSRSGVNKIITIENEKTKFRIASLGGSLCYVQLKDYFTFDKKPLVIFKGDTGIFNFEFASQGRIFSTQELFFRPLIITSKYAGKDSIHVSGKDSVQVAMRLYPDSAFNPKDDRYIELNYTIYGDDYMLKVNVSTVGLAETITEKRNSMDFDWTMNLMQQEKSIKNERAASTIYYRFTDNEVDYLSETKDDAKDLQAVSWVSFKQQFFSSAIIADKGFSSAKIRTVSTTDDSSHMLKTCALQTSIPVDSKDQNAFSMRMYFGPNKFKVLKKYDLDLERQIPLGWSFFLLRWINRYAVIPVFNWLESFGMNYGIIILILTILLKIVLFPIAYKTYLSSAKMRVLKPEIDEINKKIPKEKAMERQQATMALYKKAGVNPLAGCVPMLLQMPILIALFRFFPASIELRQQSFLWAHDLSTYDSILDLGFNIPFYGNHVSLFCLLMTVSTIIYTKVNNQLMGTQQQMPGMKFMMYAMPVMFLGFFNSFSSGLSYYYFLANMLTFLQMWIIRKTVNEEAIHAKIQENRKKPDTKKKSGFQKRLEEMAKQRGYKMPK